MKLYGISNCNTVKKARSWLEANRLAYEFHDFKKNGVSADLLRPWLEASDWTDLLNRKGLTWRGLSEAEKASVTDAHSALQLMLKKPSVIKRPVLEFNNRVLIGFDEENYLRLRKETNENT